MTKIWAVEYMFQHDYVHHHGVEYYTNEDDARKSFLEWYTSEILYFTDDEELLDDNVLKSKSIDELKQMVKDLHPDDDFEVSCYCVNDRLI